MNVWISSDSTCLGSNKPHPWASPEPSQSLPFSRGCCIKTPLNLAKAKYFPDALPSDQLSLFASCWVGIWWEEHWPHSDRAQEHQKKQQCSPGQAELVQLKAIPSKGWICAPWHWYTHSCHMPRKTQRRHFACSLPWTAKFTLNNKIPPGRCIRRTTAYSDSP